MQNKPSLEMLHLFFDNSPMATQVMSPDGKFAYVNSAFTDIWKVTLEDLGDQNIFADKVVQSKDVLPLVKRAFKGESVELPLTPINTYKSPDKTIWIRTKTYPLFNDDNEISYIVVMHEDVTKQTLVEDNLRESTEKFRALYENAPLPYQSLNEDGTFQDVNPAWLRTLGYERDEVIGKYYTDFLHPDWKSRFTENFPKFKKRGYVHDALFKIRHKKGHFLDISLEGSIGYHPDGSVKQTYCVFQDITEKLRITATLKEVQRQDTTLLSNLPGMAYRCLNNQEWTMRFISEGCRNLTGFEPEDLINNEVLSYASLIHPEDRPVVDEVVQKQILKHEYFELEYRILTKDNEIKWVSEKGLFIGDKESECEVLEGFISDITELKKSEEALKISDARYREAQKLCHVGNWEYNLSTNTFWASEETKRIYGYIGEEEEFSSEIADECILDIERARKAFDDLIAYNKPYDILFDVKTIDTGEIKTLHSVAELETDESGVPIKVMGSIHDVTDRVNIENELEKHRLHLEELVSERTIELQEAIQEMESFSYSISHDLRAPLRAISGFCSYLVDDYTDSLDEEGQRLLKVITDNAVHMDKLIADILDISRVSRAEIKTAETDMKTLALSTYLSVATDLEQSEFDIVINEMPMVSCDPNAIKQVWSNLFTNSLKYSSKSEIKRIEVGYIEEDESHVFYIKDHGVGFDQQYEKKLFGIFQRLHSLKEFAGTGVGLAIVERLVKKHDGRIWAEGEVGEGATFYFSLPKK